MSIKEKSQRLDKLSNFEKELSSLINKFSLEQYVNLPDFIIADYMMKSFSSLEIIIKQKEKYNLESINQSIEIK